MDPASSSDDGSHSSESSSSSVPEESNNKSRELVPVSFDDLPSDDSGTDMSSDSDDDDDESLSDEDSSGSEDSEEEEEPTIEERLKVREEHGVRKKKKSWAAPTTMTTGKKKSRHVPTEASSRRYDYFQRGAPSLASSGVGEEATGVANLYKARDPRLGESGLTGHFDQGAFEHNYAFLGELQQKDVQRLKDRIAARNVTGRKGAKARKRLGVTPDQSVEDDQEELTRLTQLHSNHTKSQRQREAKRTVKRKMRDEIASGQRTKEYHYKKKDWKRMELGAQYDQIKKKGGDAAVDKLLAKRRKKNLGKDGKFMPAKSAT